MVLFQNCQKKKSDLSSLDECIASGVQDCGWNGNGNDKITNLNFIPDDTNVILQNNFQETYKINFKSDEVINSNTGRGCNISDNSTWLQIKNLYVSNGICNYSYSLAPGMVRCMAISVPFGSIEQVSSGVQTELSSEVCSNNHNTICGDASTQLLFEQSFQQLQEGLSSIRSCN